MENENIDTIMILLLTGYFISSVLIILFYIKMRVLEKRIEKTTDKTIDKMMLEDTGEEWWKI